MPRLQFLHLKRGEALSRSEGHRLFREVSKNLTKTTPLHHSTVMFRNHQLAPSLEWLLGLKCSKDNIQKSN